MIWRCGTHGPLLPSEVTYTETCTRCQEPITFRGSRSTKPTAAHIVKRRLVYEAYETKLSLNS